MSFFDSFYDAFANIHSLSDLWSSVGTPEVALSIGIGVSFSILLIWLFLAGANQRVTAYHLVFMALAGALLGLALQEYTSIFDWLIVGLTFTNIGCTMFLVGILAMMVVMAWNIVATDGRTMVR